MAENNFGKGIKITSGFDLNAKAPLDNRTIVSTIEERDAHVTNNRAYEGMKVYVLNEKKEYTYTGTNWEESGGISDEQLEQLNTAYEHSQTKHIQTSDLEGFNKIISSDTQPTDENVLLWINPSENYEFEDIARINDNTTSSNTTWSSEKIFEQYALKTDIPSIDGLATENYVNEELKKIDVTGQLTDYAKKSDLPTKTSQLTNDSGFLNQIPSEYVTEDELNAKGYLTQHQDISGKADKSELHNHTNKIVLDGITNAKVSEWDNKSDFSGNYNDLINKPTIPSIDGLATENYVKNEIAKAQLEGEEIDLSGYATKSELPTKTSQLTNDSGFLTSVPSEYVTETELNAKGYLTEHQDISGKADKTELHTHSNKSVLDGITSSKVTEWDNKSTFTGNYNDLVNKPIIPSIEGLATEDYVEQEINKIDVTDQLTEYAKKTDIPDYEIVTPQMYGAVADGVADDTISVQNALNSGKSVYFPAGRYKVTSLLQVANACKISMYKPYPCTSRGDYPLSENDNHMGARIETYSTNGGIIVGDGVEIDGFYMRAMDTFTGILFKFDGTMGQSTYPSRLRLAHIILDNNSIYTVPEVMFDFVPNKTYHHILEDITIGSLRGRQFCEYGFRSIMTTSDTNWANSVRIKNLCIDLLADYSLYVEGGPLGCANWVFDCPSIQTYPYVEGDSGYIGKTGHIDIVTFKNMQDVLITGGVIWDLHAASYNRIFNIENSPKIATYCANTFDQIDTYLSGKLQAAADNLNIENMDMTLVGDATTGGNYLTLSDGANNKSVLIPGAVLDDEQVNAGISNWFSENAAPTEQIGRNKYNPNDPLTQPGYYYTGGSFAGTFADEKNGMHTSNLIEAKEGDVIRISKNSSRMGAYYLHMLDENRNWLSSIDWTTDAGDKIVDNPDTKYIRITWSHGYFTYEDRATSNICVTVNDANISYTPYAIELAGGIGSYLVLQSPNGTQFTLQASDEGVINGKCVNGDVEPPTYVTKSELEEKGYLTEHQDISGKADKTELHNHANKSILDGITSTKVTEWNNKSTFSGNYNDLTNKPTIPSLNGYATENYVNQEIQKIDVTSQLTDYAKKTDIPTVPTNISAFTNDKGYITVIPSEYVTETELNSKGYLTEVTKSQIESKLTGEIATHTHAGESVYYLPKDAFTTTAGSSTSGAYLSTKWSVTNADGITEPYDGMTIVIRVPLAGVSTAGVVLSIDGGTTYHPIVRNVSTVLSTSYAVGNTIIVTYNSTQTATAYLTSNTKSTPAGVWQIADYDSDTKTRSSNNAGKKMYIIGATTQSTSGQTTYSNSACYIGTDNSLYSENKKVATEEYIEAEFREAINKIGQLEARIQELEIRIRELYPVGTVNEDNTITIYDTLKPGTYTLKYDFEDGTQEELEEFTVNDNGGD